MHMKEQDMVSFETLTELSKKLEEKRDRLQHHLSEVIKDLDSVNNTLRLLKANKLTPESEIVFIEVPAEELKGKTIDDALVTVAERNGGSLRVRLAKNLLVKAEMLAKKNAAASVYTSIGRSERWEKVDSGVYKLLPTRTETKRNPFQEKLQEAWRKDPQPVSEPTLNGAKGK
jgi:hypothetical protein